MQQFSDKLKILFQADLDTFCPKNGERGLSPKYQALSVFSPYGPLTLCKETEKPNEPILRKVGN